MTTAQGSRTIRFLQKGKDGKGVQYIYYRTTTLTAPYTPTTDYAADGWTDTPQGVTHNIPYEWVSTRAQDNGTWGAFSTPALWTNFASDGIRENKFSSQTNIYNAGKGTNSHWDKDLRGFSATLVNGEANRIRLHPLIDKNGKWTVSGYIKAAAACTVSVDICDNGDTTLQVGTVYSYFAITANVANQSGTYNFVDFYNTWGYNIALTVKDLKVEFGAYATAYCLAEIDKVGEKGDKGDKGDQGDPGAPGEKGDPGLQGRTLRRSEWQEGVEYRNDETTTAEDGNRYLDIVCFTSNNKATGWWQCRTTHTATTATKPSAAGSTAQWTKLNNLAPTYIPLLLADDADISLIGTRQITVKNADGQVVMGMTGHSASSDNEEDTGIRFFVGSAPNADDVTFTIDKDGLPRTKGTFIGEYYDLDNIRLLDHDHFNSTQLSELFGKGIYNLSFYSPKDSSGLCATLPFTTNDWAGSRFGKDASIQACLMNRCESTDFLGGSNADYVYISGGTLYGHTFYNYTSSGGTTIAAGTKVEGVYLAPGCMLRLRSFRGSQSAVDKLEWTIENADDFILHRMYIVRNGVELSPGSEINGLTDTMHITLISRQYKIENLSPSDWNAHEIKH